MEKSTYKTCAVCHLQKPLTAFLQISGPQGNTYSNVCGHCRGSNLNAIIQPHSDIEDGRSDVSSGLRIDAKAKLLQEHNLADRLKFQETLDLQEKKATEKDTKEKHERKEFRHRAEKKHRNEYLSGKKEAFLEYKSKRHENPNDKIAKQTVLAANTATENLLKKEARTGDERSRTISFGQEGGAFIDPTHTGMQKFQSAEFQKVRTWLGRGAAIATFERQFLATAPSATGAPAKAYPTPDAPKESKSQIPHNTPKTTFTPTPNSSQETSISLPNTTKPNSRQR